MRKGFIQIATAITIGMAIIAGVVYVVREMTETRALANEAKTISIEAKTDSVTTNKDITNVRLNVARICIKLNVKCIE